MRRLAAVLAALAAGALAATGGASAGRFAVGVERGASPDALARRVEALTGGVVTREHARLRALTLHARSSRGVARLPGVAYVERIDVRRRLAFAPTDPLAGRQWHLGATRAFEAWPQLPSLAGVRVAVVDSGIDARHPEFKGRIAEARSFVGGSARTDQLGHGTFVAGLIAANVDNGVGVAGMAFPAQLIVAKVVGADDLISLEAEVKAIRWAADAGARVINLSLGGMRDPIDPSRDTYSALEAAAVAYAQAKGALVVAAVGNGDEAPRRPWGFANYPAALPHVIGVSALGRDGSVPAFSQRDLVYNDLAAPGQDIYSTVPRALAPRDGVCPNRGYSDCGPDEFVYAEGTSFAAPQVTAAAALLLAVRPQLTADQVAELLTRTAADVSPATGCRRCTLRRDPLSGWGGLDVAAAVGQLQTGVIPPADALETNDDAGARARELWGRSRRVDATIDFWDDPNDVYAVRLAGGEQLSVSLRGPAGAKLFLWRPGTTAVEGRSAPVGRLRVAHSVHRGRVERFTYRTPHAHGGWYYLQVRIGTPGSGPYTLAYAKS